MLFLGVTAVIVIYIVSSSEYGITNKFWETQKTLVEETKKLKATEKRLRQKEKLLVSEIYKLRKKDDGTTEV